MKSYELSCEKWTLEDFLAYDRTLPEMDRQEQRFVFGNVSKSIYFIGTHWAFKINSPEKGTEPTHKWRENDAGTKLIVEPNKWMCQKPIAKKQRCSRSDTQRTIAEDKTSSPEIQLTVNYDWV